MIAALIEQAYRRNWHKTYFKEKAGKLDERIWRRIRKESLVLSKGDGENLELEICDTQ